jgi:hypothetical protein
LTLTSRFLVCAFAAGAVIPAAAQADIYRYVDENGTVHFTNVPNDNRFRLYTTTRKNPDAVTNLIASRDVRSYPTGSQQISLHLAAAPFSSAALLHAVIAPESG